MNRSLKHVLLYSLIGLVGLVLLGYLVFQLSPWPSALLVRQAFESDARRVNTDLQPYVPPDVGSLLNQAYDLADEDALLDVYFPEKAALEGRKLLPVVWTHGGAWISGDKEQIANYCKILAGKGFAVVSVNYTIAPEAKYPTPVRQLNKALAYLNEQANRLHLNPEHFVLAGDSGGAHIAAQMANAISEPHYGRMLGIKPALSRAQLAGVLLYCGGYDTKSLDLKGDFGGFLRTVFWSYSGRKDFERHPDFASFSVIDYVKPSFPPAFISVGNQDPLAEQSYALAERLQELDVRVDTLFYPKSYQPGLPHEYQFHLQTEAARIALDRSVAFLKGLD